MCRSFELMGLEPDVALLLTTPCLGYTLGKYFVRGCPVLD